MSMFKVLIILEEDALAHSLREQFTNLGCTVQRLHNLNSIGTRLLSLAPKLVVSCVKSPNIDGFELAQHLLKRPTKPKLILIKSEGDVIDTKRMMTLKVDKLIPREGIEKMISDIAKGEFVDDLESTSVDETSTDPSVSRAFVIPPGKTSKYDQIMKNSELTKDVGQPMNSSKIKAFKAVLKKESEKNPDIGAERAKFVKALFED